jgi:AmmeMemoRadiSam system protein A
MSQSLLLDITRESITEVFEARNTIDKQQLIKDFPVLAQPISCFVSLYLNNKLRGSSGSVFAENSLLEEIIFHAKTAAFIDERFEPLRTSEYLQTTIELSLLTPLKELSYESIEDIKKAVIPKEDGMLLLLGEKQGAFLPQVWKQFSNFEAFFSHLLQESNLESLDEHPQVFTFQVEKQSDEPILK